MKIFRRIRDKINTLATVEQKSFWVIGPLVVLCGVMSIITTSKAYSSYLVAASTSLCIIVPSLVMLYCRMTKNYTIAYPLLCVGVSGICIPVMFLANGGFNSGMPIFCVGSTVICAFCYSNKGRLLSFIISFTMTLISFYYAKGGIQSLFVVDDSWVENDIIFSYICITIGLYVVINVILNEFRIYANSQEVLDNYMDRRVKNELIVQASKGSLTTEGTTTRVTVLFADISHFTTISERMNANQIADYLNTFLSCCEKYVHINNGILDKFIGDCIMAYWIDNNNDGKGVFEAVKTVFDIRNELTAHAQDIYDTYGSDIDFSAGIEYGDVILGNIGSKKRKEYTIIGDAVNTASRLQTSASNGELLVSSSVINVLKNRINYEAVSEKVYLKGKNKPINTYNVTSINEGVYQPKEKIDINNEKYAFYICGCRGSFPVSGVRYAQFGGETSCYVLKKDKYAIVIDCGTGLKNAKDVLADCRKIDILITHVHYDHIMGLLDMSSFPEGVKLDMYGHFGSWIGKETITTFLDTPYWPVSCTNIEFHDISVNKEYEFDERISASFYRADHPDNGTVIRLNVNNHKICIFADMEDPMYLDTNIAKNADILLYDGMFDKTNYAEFVGWGHSTWQDGCEYAIQENVNRLIITHHSPKSGDHDLTKLEKKAKERFKNASFARTGDIYVF